MKHTLLVFAIVAVIPLSVYAQSNITVNAQPPSGITIDGKTGAITGDMADIVKCAKQPYPAMDLDPKHQREVEFNFQRISNCRIVLIARHAGWVAADGKADDDPYKPEPLANPEDFHMEPAGKLGPLAH